MQRDQRFTPDMPLNARRSITPRPAAAIPILLGSTYLSMTALAGGVTPVNPTPLGPGVTPVTTIVRGTTPDENGHPRFWAFHPPPYPTDELNNPTSDAVTIPAHPWIRPTVKSTARKSGGIGSSDGAVRGTQAYNQLTTWMNEGRILGTDDIGIYFEFFGNSQLQQAPAPSNGPEVDDNWSLLLHTNDGYNSMATCVPISGVGECADNITWLPKGERYSWQDDTIWTTEGVTHWGGYIDDFIAAFSNSRNDALNWNTSHPPEEDVLIPDFPLRGMFDLENPQLLTSGTDREDIFKWENSANDPRADTVALPGFGIANGYTADFTYNNWVQFTQNDTILGWAVPDSSEEPLHSLNASWLHWWNNAAFQMMDGALDASAYKPLRDAFPEFKSGNWWSSMSTDGGIGPEGLIRKRLQSRHNPTLDPEHLRWWNGSGELQSPVFYGLDMMNGFDENIDLNGTQDTALRIHALNADAIQHSYGGGQNGTPLHTNIVPYIQLPRRPTVPFYTSENFTRDLLVLCRSKQIDEYFVFNDSGFTSWHGDILNWDILQHTAEQAYSDAPANVRFWTNGLIEPSSLESGSLLAYSDYEYLSISRSTPQWNRPAEAILSVIVDSPNAGPRRAYIDMRMESEQAEVWFRIKDQAHNCPGPLLSVGILENVTSVFLGTGRQALRFDLPDGADYIEDRYDGTGLVEIYIYMNPPEDSDDSLLLDFATIVSSDNLTPPPCTTLLLQLDLNDDGFIDMDDYVIMMDFIEKFESGEIVCDCTVDINGDGVVDTADLGILISQFGNMDCNPVTNPCSGDLNGDDVVDTADLGILVAQFGNEPCPGDLDNDCDIDEDDLMILQDNIGNNSCQ